MLLITAAAASPVLAQAEVPTWSTPLQLSGDDNLLFPTIAADPFGGVHILWVQGVEPSAKPDAIMTTYWNGTNWSPPNDILVAPPGSEALYDMPRVTADTDGKIYLVWVTGGQVLFSSALAAMSTNAHAWSAPVAAIQVDTAHLPQIAVDSQDTIHVITADRVPGGNILYAQSRDGGVTWSDAVSVSLIEPGATRTPDNPQLLVDGKGNLHVFWAENYPPEYVGREVYHSLSTDGGLTWSLPTRLSYSEETGDWDGRPTAAVDASNRLHVVWVCGQVNRCYRQSEDQGITWSDVDILFTPLLGSAGWDTMVADDVGSVYWVGTLRYPQAVYAAVLNEGRWQQPPRPIVSETDWGAVGEAHYPQAALALGNRLHLAMVEGDAGPVWYMSAVTSGPAVPPLLVPTQISTPAVAAAPESNTSIIHTPVATIALKDEADIKPLQYAGTPAVATPIDSTFVGVVSVIFTLVLAVALVVRPRSRS